MNLIRKWPNSLGCFLLLDSEGGRNKNHGAGDIRDDGLGAGYLIHAGGGAETG